MVRDRTNVVAKQPQVFGRIHFHCGISTTPGDNNSTEAARTLRTLEDAARANGYIVCSVPGNWYPGSRPLINRAPIEDSGVIRG